MSRASDGRKGPWPAGGGTPAGASHGAGRGGKRQKTQEKSAKTRQDAKLLAECLGKSWHPSSGDSGDAVDLAGGGSEALILESRLAQSQVGLDQFKVTPNSRYKTRNAFATPDQ